MGEIANERRNFARLDLQLKAAFGLDSFRFSGAIDCMGFGGVRILSKRTFPEATILKLKFSLPNESEVFECQAKVAWVQDDKSMGVQFLNLRPDQIVLLEKILTPSVGGTILPGTWD